MYLFHLNNDIVEYLFNNLNLTLICKCSRVCNLFYYITIKRKIYLLNHYNLFKIWHDNYKESLIIGNIIDKLYSSSSIDLYTYLNLDRSSLENLDKSIYWNRSYWDKQIWKEYFIPRISGGDYIEWDEDELNFLERNYNIYPE